MSDLYNFISGGIPGGFFILIIALLIVNLTLLFFKSSKLLDPDKVLKKAIRFSILIVVIYIGFWFFLRPPLPQIRIIVLPGIGENKNMSLSADNFELPEKFQQIAFDNLTRRFIFHRWEWLFETIDDDSLQSPGIWKKTALSLKPGILIEPVKEGNQWKCLVHSRIENEEETQMFYVPAGFSEASVLNELNDEYDLFNDLYKLSLNFYTEVLQAKIEINRKRIDNALKIIEKDTSLAANLIKAEALVKKGLKVVIDREKAKYIEEKNEYFEKAKSLLHNLRRKRFEQYKVAYLLGRIAWREEDYNNADLYLKTALSFDPTNPRIHYGLSFLHYTRFQELGYKNRIELLEKAVYLDPGFRNAVYELANDYYRSGTGTQIGMGTNLAMKTIEDYLKISGGDGQILSLLGSIYIKIQKFDEALEVFTGLKERYPQDSNMVYNIGIVHYFKKDYKQALACFLKAIEMDGNLDSYLYAGIIYKETGDYDKALHYFRQRVRLKTGDDDKYAKEAMAGIRKVRELKNAGNSE
ncbi:MAG: tetratricopeptide repeat protein [Calditrichaceae bacterium]|nr:tetratricopeptide repeat protein [Calditrichaceae bacterium]MBN2709211.1 tetratricopeptide repeat protein [Calditrichaceae bacterium]RQV96165.1 MAG: hypothetical protein EH224_05520 [Calditrichota bacterium]